MDCKGRQGAFSWRTGFYNLESNPLLITLCHIINLSSAASVLHTMGEKTWKKEKIKGFVAKQQQNQYSYLYFFKSLMKTNDTYKVTNHMLCSSTFKTSILAFHKYNSTSHGSITSLRNMLSDFWASKKEIMVLEIVSWLLSLIYKTCLLGLLSQFFKRFAIKLIELNLVPNSQVSCHRQSFYLKENPSFSLSAQGFRAWISSSLWVTSSRFVLS